MQCDFLLSSSQKKEKKSEYSATTHSPRVGTATSFFSLDQRFFFSFFPHLLHSLEIIFFSMQNATSIMQLFVKMHFASVKICQWIRMLEIMIHKCWKFCVEVFFPSYDCSFCIQECIICNKTQENERRKKKVWIWTYSAGTKYYVWDPNGS